jgi:hypothetical protein
MDPKILEIFYFNSDPEKVIVPELVQKVADIIEVASRVVEVYLHDYTGQKITIYAPQNKKDKIVNKIDELYEVLPKRTLITIM